jgi:aldose 1-epimerase
MKMLGIEKDGFGVTADGVSVERYTLRNSHGMVVSVITYGATVTELCVPDRDGHVEDLVLGFDHLAQYESESPYFGCTVGRVAFRIVDGQFTLNGKTYQLTRNNHGQHHLHGGSKGFSKVVWKAEPEKRPDAVAVKLTHFSPDGDEGYPGNLQVAAIYSLTEQNELCIDYSATADQPTPINLTHHGYFNLAGAGSGDVLGHVVRIDADRYSPTDATLCPTGELAPVRGTPLDFTRPAPIGSRIGKPDGVADGYDLAYLCRDSEGELATVAVVEEPRTGRRMEVLSTEPAVIFYTGQYLDGTLKGKRGVTYPKHAGLCLEPGRLPDAVHHAKFPSVILPPGQTYRHTCVYRFRTAI